MYMLKILILLKIKNMLGGRDNIINSLAGKNVIIWGARMTGIGALRQLTKKQIIDIVLILTKDRDQEKIESFIMKGPFGNIFLN